MTESTALDWRDDVTSLPGPAFWEVVLETESARCARYRRPATVVLVEVVGFGDLVRLWGPDAAARGVIEVAAALRKGSRASDYVARLADDRFGVILTETDEIAAINMIERVRPRCDKALAAQAAWCRAAFGWASATATMTLADAVARAEELLRLEARAE